MKTTLYEDCISADRMDLIKEWIKDRNEPEAPWTVTSGSHKKIWWRCSEGHEWQAVVYSRWDGHGCPVCGGQKVVRGVNDLATVSPELASEWLPDRNGSLTPDSIYAGSHKKIWWRCSEGHEWQASVSDRRQGNGCPYCASRTLLRGYNDLASVDPSLASEWHRHKNGTLTPSDVFPSSTRKVWWECSKGHEWKASVSSRAKVGSGCPVCAGRKVMEGFNDLKTLYPSIAKEWHPEKNGTLSPSDVRPSSNRRAWWICDKGHEWQAMIKGRVQMNSGCPYCTNRKVLKGFNDLETIEPRLASEWAQDLNGSLRPDMVTCGSSQKAWWRCSEGHVWRAVIHTRTGKKRCGCPVCAGKVSRKRLEWMERQALQLKSERAAINV